MAYQQPLSARKIERLVQAHRDGETIDEAAVRKYTKVSSPEYLALYLEAFRASAGLKPTVAPPAEASATPPAKLRAKTFVLIGFNGAETELEIDRETSSTIVFKRI